MTFFEETGIERWQFETEAKLKLAFRETRKRKSVTRRVTDLLKQNPRVWHLAVNRHARMRFSRAICEQMASRFCDGSNGCDHSEEMYLVTLADRNCVRSSLARLEENDLSGIKDKLRYGLRGFSYFGMVEPAFYVNHGAEPRYGKGRCISWHLHAIVWGVSLKELRRHLKNMRLAGRYVAVVDGQRPTHSKRIKQGTLPQNVAYILKSPSLGYRVSCSDREDSHGRTVFDQHGEVSRSFLQTKAVLRHAERIELFNVMKHLDLEALSMAGGEGRPLLDRVKRQIDAFDDKIAKRTGRPRKGSRSS
jgi:hypothetical protein